MQNFIYVENASLAHLCYEACLLDKSSVPLVGGQALCIADAGPPPTYGDVYHALHVLSGGRATFPSISPTLALLIATLVEPVHVARLKLSLSSHTYLARLASYLPRLPGDLLNLQPSLFALVSVHMLFDDTQARRVLGYKPQWTTLQGLCALVDAYENGGRAAEARQLGAGLGVERLQNWNLKTLGGLLFPGVKDVRTPSPKTVPEPAGSDGGLDVSVGGNMEIDIDVKAETLKGQADALRKRAS